MTPPHSLYSTFQGFIHDLVVWNNDWYFKTNVDYRDTMCEEIAEIHRLFRKVMLEQRPLVSHEKLRKNTLTTTDIHAYIKDGQQIWVTNALLEDAKRGDDELAQFDETEFKFSRRADWKETNALQHIIVHLQSTVRPKLT
jgi:hypothetical protein